jgi:hypothetical protein
MTLTHFCGTVSHLAGTGTSLLVNITFNPTDPVTVSGTITDLWAGSGTHLAGATVQLKDSSGNNYGAAVSTNSNGEYEIPDVAAGNYTIEVTGLDYAPAVISSFSVAADDVTKDTGLYKQVTDFNLSTLIPAPVAGMNKPTAITVQSQYTGTPISWNSAANPCTEARSIPPP